MVKAQETNLEGILEGKKQYQVPLYQRVYSWGKKQHDQVWDDVVELARNRREAATATHFIGSVVLAASPDNAAVGMQRFLVVDGQQRLTTFTVLLAALRDHLVSTVGQEHRTRIDHQYLINAYEPGQPAKVLPTQADRTSYLEIIRASAKAGGTDAVGAAYRQFLAKIASIDDPDDPDDLTEIENAILRGLAVVAVTAEAGDNAHRIFESLNNTGLKLRQSDLLKNYLFMRLQDRAEQVYDSVWLPLEEALSAENLELLFWLDLVQRDERAKQADTYLGQQRRLDKLTSVAEIEAEVHRIARLGDVLATILEPERESFAGIRRRLERIRAWGSTTAYPIVMHLLTRRAAGTATDEQVERALTYLESYFVRRIVIGRATASLNRTLLQAVSAITDEPEIDVALRSYLSRGRKYFATDDQVREASTTVAFYWQGRGPQKKLILQWLEESYGSKEIVDPATLTIEHVLPQTMSDAVRDEFIVGFGDDADIAYEHERLVHTLGNLTLTGYNSELSNRPFAEKRSMLGESGLRMNQAIAKHASWGVDEILVRGAELAERIIDLWPGPDPTVAQPADEPSALRSAITSITAEIPAGRWTTYGEVALIAGTYPQPLANLIARYPMPNAWRVMQSGGTISPGFRWAEPGRDDDPKKVLEAEGVAFDASGRATAEQFLTAQELADLAGLDIGADESAGRVGADGTSSVPAKQQAFFTQLREYGQTHAQHIKRWQTPRPQQWYDISVGTSRAHLSLKVDSVRRRVAVELYMPNGDAVFPRLLRDRPEIEAELGMDPEWSELHGKKASIIRMTRQGDFQDEQLQPELIAWMIETADTFVRVFSSRL